MPTLNASSSDFEIASPWNRNTISPCFVPAPPGVAGKSVASESTTSARNALWMRGVHAERLEEVVERGDPEHPRDRLRQDARRGRAAAGRATIAKPAHDPRPRVAALLDEEDEGDHEPPARSTSSPSSVHCACSIKKPQSTDGSRE